MALLVGAVTVTAAPAATPAATTAPTLRVNAGGPKLAGTPPWSADSATTPSPYATASGGNRRLSTTTTIVMRNPSLPAGTPSTLFRTARSANRLTWRFPVPAGLYSVRLFFAEIDSTRQFSDSRMFDVTVGDQLVLDDFDVFAATGGYTGSMRSFVTNASTEVVVDMRAVTGPPIVSAVEIVPYVPPVDPGAASWSLLPNSHYRRSEQTFAYSSVTGRFYLVGGIAKVEGVHVRRIEEYDPVARRWATVATLPSNINHVQAVELGGLIYYIAGWAGPYRTYAFNPVTRRCRSRRPCLGRAPEAVWRPTRGASTTPAVSTPTTRCRRPGSACTTRPPTGGRSCPTCRGPATTSVPRSSTGSSTRSADGTSSGRTRWWRTTRTTSPRASGSPGSPRSPANGAAPPPRCSATRSWCSAANASGPSRPSGPSRRTTRPPTRGGRCPTWRSARTASRPRSATAGCTSPPARRRRARRTRRRSSRSTSRDRSRRAGASPPVARPSPTKLPPLRRADQRGNANAFYCAL